MTTFTYKGFDAGGRRAQGLIEAGSLKEARERLAERGVLPETVAAAAAPSGRADALRRADRRAAVYRELAAMLRAGLPLVRALDLLIDSPEFSGARSALAGMRDRIREGASPAEAFAASRHPTPYEISMLEAGQRSGALDTACVRLADYLEDAGRLRSRLLTALLYPAVVAALAGIVAVVMLGFLLPSFAKVWEEARIPLPALTRVLLAAGRGLAIAGLPALAAALGWRWLTRRRRASAAARLRREQRRQRWPVYGASWRALMSLRFARTLALLLEGGVPLVEAVLLAGRATGSAWIAELAGAEADRVRHGSTLADALRRMPPLAGSLPGWVQAGEASGSLAEMLGAAARQQQDHWERTVARAAALALPLLILLLGAFVFLIALAILLPILQLNRSLG